MFMMMVLCFLVFIPSLRPLLKWFDISFFPSDSRTFFHEMVGKIIDGNMTNSEVSEIILRLVRALCFNTDNTYIFTKVGNV